MLKGNIMKLDWNFSRGEGSKQETFQKEKSTCFHRFWSQFSFFKNPWRKELFQATS